MKRVLPVVAAAACATLASAWLVHAQTLSGVNIPVLSTGDLLGTVIAVNDPAVTDPAASEPATSDPPHLPKGGKFKLFGTAADDLDPENSFNQVISFNTNAGQLAGAFKIFGDHVQVQMLDNQVELKYFLSGTKTCGGGSPRVQLGIDIDGDNKFDGNAFGYIGDKPFGGLCLMNQWVFEDMTNSSKKWDLSQFATFGSGAFCGGNSMTCSWQEMENFFATFPNHRVLNYVLVDDSSGFFLTDAGCAFYDLVSAGAQTLTNWDDTSDGGKQPNGCP